MRIELRVRVGDARLHYRGPAEELGDGGVRGLLQLMLGRDDAPTDPDPSEPDKPDELTFEVLRGRVHDFWTALPPESVTVTLDGATINTEEDGSFELANPPIGPYWLEVQAPGYEPTLIGPIVSHPGADIGVIYAFSIADVRRQYVQAGIAPMAGALDATIIADLRGPTFEPLEGVAPIDLRLLAPDGNTVGTGPVRFRGAVDFEALPASVVGTSKFAYVAFLAVSVDEQRPPAILQLDYVDESGEPASVFAPIEVRPGRVTLTRVQRPA